MAPILLISPLLAYPAVHNEQFALVTFNCFGLKSSINYVTDLMRSVDILFLSESWLLQSEIVTLSKEVFNPFYVTMKSSLKSDDLAVGRPFGGVGFVCRKRRDITYVPINCESDRLHGLEVMFRGSKVLTVYGVYMPYNNNTPNQTELYMDTLHQLSLMIEETSGPTPFCVVGDMNAELPVKATMQQNWYKQRPFNRHSVLLYDFMCDHELFICNGKRNMNDFTYSKGATSSYIDYIAINSYAYDNILNCEVLHHEDSNNSDHLGVSCQLNVECQLTEGDAYSTQRTHCRPKWENDDFRRAYLQSLQSALAKLPVTNPDEVEPENAQAVINSQCSILGKAMHQAAYAGLSCDGNIRRVHWWSNDCTTYRNRTRLYFHIWKCMGRPRVGQSYECYKSARKQYRNACRLASNAALGKACKKTSELLRCNRHRQFWNVINSATSCDKQRKCKVTLDCLEHFYEDKFKMNRNTTETIQGNEAMVSDKFERLRHIHFTSAMISEMEVVGYIRQLNLGKAAGADGLTAEHYVYALGSSVPLHISSMLTVCLQHGLVPETFLHGVLIPIYKTGKDSSKANSYRPVTLSVTLTKILEMYILETCSVHHQPHPAQFGFTSHRGTDMAIAVAHDVSQYYNSRGSSTFTCSL